MCNKFEMGDKVNPQQLYRTFVFDWLIFYIMNWLGVDGLFSERRISSLIWQYWVSLSFFAPEWVWVSNVYFTGLYRYIKGCASVYFMWQVAGDKTITWISDGWVLSWGSFCMAISGLILSKAWLKSNNSAWTVRVSTQSRDLAMSLDSLTKASLSFRPTLAP